MKIKVGDDCGPNIRKQRPMMTRAQKFMAAVEIEARTQRIGERDARLSLERALSDMELSMEEIKNENADLKMRISWRANFCACCTRPLKRARR